MPHKLIVRLGGRIVGRRHGHFASHVAVVVLGNGSIRCMGWGLRVDAEAALNRVRSREGRPLYSRVHTTEEDSDSSQRLTRRVPPDVALRLAAGL